MVIKRGDFLYSPSASAASLRTRPIFDSLGIKEVFVVRASMPRMTTIAATTSRISDRVYLGRSWLLA